MVEERTPFRLGVSRHFERKLGRGEPLIIEQLISHITGRRVEMTPNLPDSDLSLISIINLRREWDKAIKFQSDIKSLEYLAKTMTLGTKALILSFENLEHPIWFNFGQMLMESSLPRTSFFPRTKDPNGARFPYWWNFLDWPQFPRPDTAYRRYGRLYSLEKLMNPLPKTRFRKNRACWIGSYEPYEPRSSVLAGINRRHGLDVWGGAGRRFLGPKIKILRKYKYAAATENSWGLGYDSEKIPEAWDAGCIPVGMLPQEGSDFNYKILTASLPEKALEVPLLNKTPDISDLTEYLACLLD